MKRALGRAPGRSLFVGWHLRVKNTWSDSVTRGIALKRDGKAMLALRFAPLAFAVAVPVSGCDDPCEDAARPVESTLNEGVVGVGASQADECSLICGTCSRSNYDLELLATDVDVDSAESAAAAYDTSDERHIIKMSDGSFEIEVNSGRYLICETSTAPNCAAIRVQRDQVTTANYIGPQFSGFRVFDEDGAEQEVEMFQFFPNADQ